MVLGEGGHTTEMLRIAEGLKPTYHYSYLVPKHDHISETKIRIAGPIYRANLPRAKSPSLLNTLKYLFLCTFQELVILLKVRPKVVMSAGAGIAVPVSVFGWLFGVKIIYIESATRVQTLSLSGKILYPIAHLFFVQWPLLKEKYPKAIYAGRLV